MKLGKIRIIRDDAYLKVKERRFKKAKDKTIYVAQVTLHKKPSPLSPHKKEFWIGYYTEAGQQRGLGFFPSKAKVPKGFKSAFAGLDIKKTKKPKKKRRR